jgi:hypothetical protein
MSAIVKYIVCGVVLALIGALAVQTYVVHKQSVKLGEANLQLKTLNDYVAQANKSVKTQSVIADVTDEVVTNATKRITTNTSKGTAIKAVVDNVTKKVANEKISNSVASAAYISSMWDAYCEAEPGNGTCTTRQPIN